MLKATNRFAEAESLTHMRRMVGILLRLICDTDHRHPHLQTVLKNYRILLTKAGRTEAQADEEIAALAAEYGVSP